MAHKLVILITLEQLSRTSNFYYTIQDGLTNLSEIFIKKEPLLCQRGSSKIPLELSFLHNYIHRQDLSVFYNLLTCYIDIFNIISLDSIDKVGEHIFLWVQVHFSFWLND